MNPNNEKEILEQLDFRTLYSAELEGFEGSDGLGESVCCFCNDENRTLYVNLRDGNFSCPSCGAAGSVLDFFALKYEIGEDEAMVLISEIVDANSEPAEPGIETEDEEPDADEETLEDEIISGFYFDGEIYQSEAFLSLGKNSIKVLIAFLEAAPDNGSGQLSISHNFLEESYRIPRAGVSKAIGELRDKKFLELVHRGGCGVGDRNVYRLSENYKFWTPKKKEAQYENFGPANEDLTGLEGFA